MNKISNIFKALGDINRIRILKMLETRKMCVCEIASVLEVSQPAASKQLKKLVKAGLIESEQDGFWTNYFILPENDKAKKLLRLLSQWLNDDPIIKQDVQKTEKADRKRLCCN